MVKVQTCIPLCHPGSCLYREPATNPSHAVRVHYHRYTMELLFPHAGARRDPDRSDQSMRVLVICNRIRKQEVTRRLHLTQSTDRGRFRDATQPHNREFEKVLDFVTTEHRAWPTPPPSAHPPHTSSRATTNCLHPCDCVAAHGTGDCG